ncbi:HipA N-terminal domain-containing protein [Flagellimonas marinaquae]
MVKTDFVKIWGKMVGAVAWDEQQEVGVFEYDPKFQNLNWNLSPLKMPINSGNRIFRFPENRLSGNSEFNTFKQMGFVVENRSLTYKMLLQKK